MTLPRRDGLPEYTKYRDTGCDLFESCLRCPLSRCRYELHDGATRLLNEERDREIRRRRREGATVRELAAEFGLSTRTISRVS